MKATMTFNWEKHGVKHNDKLPCEIVQRPQEIVVSYADPWRENRTQTWTGRPQGNKFVFRAAEGDGTGWLEKIDDYWHGEWKEAGLSGEWEILI